MSSSERYRGARATGPALTFAVLIALAGGLEAGFETLLPYGSWRQLALTAGVNVLVALSLTIVNGWAGQFSLGHAGFLGVGAYGAAVVASNAHLAWPGGVTWARSLVIVPASVGTGALAAALCGLAVGLPSLRLRGDYLAVVTLAFAEVVRLLVATASPDGGANALTRALARLGGPGGYAGPDDRGVPLYAGPFWVALVLGVGIWSCWWLKFSPWGRALRAVRDDELAAAACGVSATRYRVSSFVLAAAGAGLAGGLLALLRDGSPLVQPAQFTLQTSFDAVVMVMVGGAGSVSGAVLGALFVTFAGRGFEALQGTPALAALQAAHPALDLNAVRTAAYALLLLALVRARPQGAFGDGEALAERGAAR
ncbi:MAG TPA: branched-chain amino acid ABC transporter permease [Polyangiaceae bacterium]|nr:branched-chain amino acid ABC transporter permease [Polyangiaceae bacterium]